MNLKQTRLVTDDVQKLTSFYEKLTGATADVISSGYVEFQHSPCAGLAITSAATAKIYGEGVLASGANRSLVLDFEVRDVDAHYTRLKESVMSGFNRRPISPGAIARCCLGTRTAISSICLR